MTQPLVGKQILIVEDEQVFRSLLDSWFSSLGATTVLAAGGTIVAIRISNCLNYANSPPFQNLAPSGC
jgi:CheY-like chemotaxis protein